MSIIPSRQQWKRWTLPSKIGYAAFIIGILSLIIMLIFKFCGDNVSKSDLLRTKSELIDTMKTITQSLISFEFNNAPYLNEKYDLGYCLVGIKYNKMIVPHTSHISMEYEIDWTNFIVKKITENEVLVYISKVEDLVNGNNIKDSYFSVYRVSNDDIGLAIFRSYIVVEYLGEDHNGIYVVVGFITRQD